MQTSPLDLPNDDRIYPNPSKMKQKNQPAVLSYYGLYLLQYLKENHPDKPADADFIAMRDELASDTFEQARLVGYSVEGAQELAMQALLQGFHFSEYHTLADVLESEFADTVPPEKIQPLALKLLPKFKEIFSGYPLSDDFARSPEYDNLYTELTGAVAIHIDEYGI